MTLFETLFPMLIVGSTVAAGGLAYTLRVSPPVAVVMMVGGVLAVPVGMFLLIWVADVVHRARHGPWTAPGPCQRGCPPETLRARLHDGATEWQCPCGLTYVLRFPSFGTQEMRSVSPGRETPLLRRRFWWRWRPVPPPRSSPYR